MTERLECRDAASLIATTGMWPGATRADPRGIHVALARGRTELEDVLLYRATCRGPTRLAGESSRHLIVINAGPETVVECAIGSDRITHRCPPGNLTLIPSGSPWAVATVEDVDFLVAAIPVESAVMAAVGAPAVRFGICARTRGFDQTLLSILSHMSDTDVGVRHAADWFHLGDVLAERLVSAHALDVKTTRRGELGPDAMRTLVEFLDANLAEPVRIDNLADLLRHKRSHFPRIFRRTTGMSPYQFVMRMRLKRARDLIARGGPLAETAAATGFAHQSHLTNTMRRLLGVTPGTLTSLMPIAA